MKRGIRIGLYLLGTLWALWFVDLAWAQCPIEIDCVTVPITPGGSPGSGGGTWVCAGPSTVGAIFFHYQGIQCAEGQIVIDCDGTVLERRVFAIGGDLCPTAVAAFRRYCADPDHAFGGSEGFCELVDYYGNPTRLRVCAPPHVIEARPYPVGFVAREDPFGTFHPTTRLKWLPPPLGNPTGNYPTYANSGWLLWTWGSTDRGPGDKPFPCDMSEGELLSNNVPAGTTCLRARLWSAPGFDRGLNPILLPGLLEFPTRRLRVEMPPGREIALNFPYASHPATGQTQDVQFGGKELPAFPGYFQRWWLVRFRVDIRRVKDHTRREERCEPVPDANGDGRPDRGGNCWTTIGDPPVAWPGDKETVEVIERKEWETEERDGILDLTALGRPYAALHPAWLFIRGPDRTWEVRYVLRNGLPYLWIPLAVREGQGAVCADPTCGGYTGPSGP